MLNDLKRDDEEGRLRALERLHVLDTADQEPFDKIVSLVRQILKVPMSTVSLVDRERQWFKAQRGLGFCQTARDISFCTHAIGETTPFIIRDAALDDRFSQSPLVIGEPFIRSYAGIPLMTPDGYNVGALCAMDTRPRAFPETEISILKGFSKVIIDELELMHTAAVDVLSGVFNRRAWTQKAQAELNRAKLLNRSMAVAIFDIDRFKIVNDTYGHPIGDIVIKYLSTICASKIRPSDIFGRIGGEEFALAMPETSSSKAAVVVEGMRTMIADEPIDVGQKLHVTVSVGIAELRHDDDLDSLILRADKALYRAKMDGRNCTRVSNVGP